MTEKTAGEWTSLSAEEKKQKLYRSQKELLDQFLENGAIDRRQYEKSLHDLSEKMGMTGSGAEGK